MELTVSSAFAFLETFFEDGTYKGVGMNMTANAGKGGLRFLVVDSDAVSQANLRDMLQQSGYFCHVESDAAMALARLSESTYDVIFMEVFLRGLTGEQFLLAIRRKDPRTQVIVMSLEDSEEVIQRLLRLGADAYLTKPLEERTVRRAIAEAIGRIEVNNGSAELSASSSSHYTFIANMLHSKIREGDIRDAGGSKRVAIGS
jgi:two-component system chemotaxis response regulator CheY